MLSSACRVVTVVVAPAALAAPLALAPAAFANSSVPVTPIAMATPQQSGDGQMMLQMAQQYAAALRGLHGAAFEQTFLGEMVPHHAAAVAMARLEVTRGTHPQLKAVARRIIADQNRQIGQMTGWLHSWYGLTPAQAAARAPADVKKMISGMHGDMGTMSRSLATVPRGTGFDRAFMAAMVPHHETALAEANTVSGRATHRQLTALARQITSGQTAEITRMRAWLRAWYGASAQ